MPSKEKASTANTSADDKVAIEAKRLRARASPSLLQSKVPQHATPIPAALRKSDGADIIKRNANRKKKYLFVFPGALSLPASGGKVGSLTALDTRTPVLNIHFPTGTLRLLGTLVFPQNAFLSVKPTKSAVQVLDVFETMIVFSEWRWVGDPASNPAGLPVPLPQSIKAPSQQLWLTETPKSNSGVDDADVLQLSSESESALEEASDDYLSTAPKIDLSAPVRSNPRRKGRVVNYSQLEENNSDENNAAEDDEQASDGTNEKPTKRRRASEPKSTGDDAQTYGTSKTEDAPPERGSRRKRRRVDYLANSDDEADANGYVENGAENDMVEDRERTAQPEARVLQFDDSVELVETTAPSSSGVKAPRVRRNVRKIKYSQESDEEDVEPGEDDGEDDGDADFAMTIDDGEESDVVVVD